MFCCVSYTLSSHLIHFNAQLVSHESNYAEDDETCKNTRRTVAKGYEYCVPIEIVVKSIVTGQGDQPSPTGW